MARNSAAPPKTTISNLIPARRWAWLAISWERLWPLALPALGVISLFLIVSWMGFWPLMSEPVRIAVLVVLALGFVASLLPLRQFRKPASVEVDGRIERLSHLAHRPVTAQGDVQAKLANGKDPFANALWREHQRRMAEGLDNLKSGAPVPKVASFDPFAMRALVGLLLFVALGAGWGNLSGRIGDAFRNHLIVDAVASGRVDAWITPPAYTNKPPLFLSRIGQEKVASATVPEGSVLTVRVLDLEEPRMTFVSGGDEQIIDPGDAKKKTGETATSDAKVPAKPSSTIYTAKLGKDGNATLYSGDSAVETWSFAITPDENPSILFADKPAASSRGTTEFSYTVEDDYGVVTARAEIVAAQKTSEDARPLVKAPEIGLPLPRRRAKQGKSKTSQDLTNHPWAGAEVKITLFAEDDAGQTGFSETETFKLPQRVFTRPLAKAVVFERLRLAMDANAQRDVAEMLDVITSTHPETFINNLSHYTALRVIYRGVKRATNDDELRDMLDLMWETALAIEDGDLSAAERRLRDAQERLSKALEDGASDEEIAKLMDELRQAMNQFMQEMAEQMAKNQQNQQSMPMDPNMQALRQQDLDRMMDQIEDLARSGSRDEARRLLEEMQRMMNNLQMARPQNGQQQQNDQFSEQMNKLGEMMRQQQELMDQTFDMQRRQQEANRNQQQQGQRQQQGQNGQQQQQGQQRGERQQGQQQGGQEGQGEGQQPMTAEEFAEAMKKLQQQQGELQRQMEEMQQAMRDMGMEPGQLGEAGEAMGQAEGALGEGQSGEATEQQGRALQAMREGAQQMMQNMQNQAGEQGRRGERGQHGQQTRNDQDPLGRPSRSRGPQLGDEPIVPDGIDAQRAREILDAIRRRLSDPARPRLELDYLDRLLPTQ